MNVADGKTKKTLVGHQGLVWSAAVSADGKLVASGSDDGTAKIWDAASGKLLKTLTFSALCKRIVEAGGVKEDVIAVQSVAFSPDGRTLATAAGHIYQMEQVDLWDTSTGALKGTVEQDNPVVDQVVFSPDGKMLAAAGRLVTTRLWNTSSLREIETIEGMRPIAFSNDGKALAHGKSPTLPVGPPAEDDHFVMAETEPTIVIRKLPTRH